MTIKYIELDDGSFVVVHVAIIWGAEDGYHHGELLASIPAMHLVALKLSFVGSNDRDQVVPLEEVGDGILAVEVGASSNIVGSEWSLTDTIIVLDRVGPNQIAE